MLEFYHSHMKTLRHLLESGEILENLMKILRSFSIELSFLLNLRPHHKNKTSKMTQNIKATASREIETF